MPGTNGTDQLETKGWTKCSLCGCLDLTKRGLKLNSKNILRATFYCKACDECFTLDAVVGGYPPTAPRAVNRTRRGLWAAERLVLDQLAEAWNAWCELGQRRPDDDQEMQISIHRAQHLIALRVARRMDPEVWSQADEVPVRR